MPTNARQLWSYHLAIAPRCGPELNRSNSPPGISDARFRLRALRQPRAAIAASDAMKRTTIIISKKVNVPRVNAFKAGAILLKTGNRTSALQKKIDNVSAAAFLT